MRTATSSLLAKLSLTFCELAFRSSRHLTDSDVQSYYQVIMMIDIFQYSNMYTLRKSVQWLADEPHVREECGPYVTRPGLTRCSAVWPIIADVPCAEMDTPDWPKLLHLYSRLKPGITVLEWMQEYNVQDLGIDVRRFVSFGVVKVSSYFVAGGKRTETITTRVSCEGSTAGLSWPILGGRLVMRRTARPCRVARTARVTTRTP